MINSFLLAYISQSEAILAYISQSDAILAYHSLLYLKVFCIIQDVQNAAMS